MTNEKLDNLVRIRQLKVQPAQDEESRACCARVDGSEHWRVLDHAHRKRNLAEYEGDVDVDDQLLEALIRVADLIADKAQRR